MICPKALEKSNEGTLSGDFVFVNCCFQGQGACIMESFNIYISMATEQTHSTGEEDGVILSKATELVSLDEIVLSNVKISVRLLTGYNYPKLSAKHLSLV